MSGSSSLRVDSNMSHTLGSNPKTLPGEGFDGGSRAGSHPPPSSPMAAGFTPRRKSLRARDQPFHKINRGGWRQRSRRGVLGR